MPEETETPPAAEPAPKPGLLPPVLMGASVYLWLWLLPMGLLFVLNLQSYWLIEGNMSEAQRANAYWLGAFNLFNCIAGLGFYFLARARAGNQPSVFLTAIPAIALHVGYLWYASAISDHMIPVEVTNWIYPLARFFYHQYALCMLPLFWGIIHLACSNTWFLPKKLSINIALAIGAPFALYIIGTLIDSLELWSFFSRINPILFACLIVGLGLVMFFGIVRALMLLFRGIGDWGVKRHAVTVLVIALAMPIGGLILNRSIPFPVDFQAWEVYALVVVNTALLLIATLRGREWPRASFCLLCAVFPFTLYFFFVFLPYTPLFILGCVAIGTGFLALTPTFLFTLHLFQLLRAHRISRSSGHGTAPLLALGALCFLLLPAFFTGRGLMDKAALNEALDFVYTPNLTGESVEYAGNRMNLRRALASHRNYKNGIYYPLLSDYYSWLVFNNLVLPDVKIETLEERFFGSKGSTENFDPLAQRRPFWRPRSVRDRARMPRANPPSREVDVTRQELELVASSAGATTATLTLELTNVSPNNAWGGAEYITQLQAPPGVFVNGFRLRIDGEPVPGRIFERKTAVWVYAMIRDSERRDPGLLVYNNPGEIELRVFPINRDTPATVEIDFLLPDDLASITPPPELPGPETLIPALYPDMPQLARGSDYNYLTPLNPETLPAAPRDRYLHLIIDRSADNGYDGQTSQLMNLAEERFPELEVRAITLANYDVIPADADADFNDALSLGGGLDLDKALAHAIARYTDAELDESGGSIPAEPVFLIVGQNPLNELPKLEKTRIWQWRLSQLNIYSVGRSGEARLLTSDKQPDPPLLRIGDSIRPAHPRRSLIFPASGASPEYYDPAEGGRWLPLTHETHENGSDWESCARLWVSNHRYAASPGSAGDTLAELVSASRERGALIPATSYIVVENEAQWRILQLKEGQKLHQNEALDFLETPTPPMLIVIAGFGLSLIWQQRRRARSLAGGRS